MGGISLGGLLALSFALVDQALALKPVRDYAAIPSNYGILYQEVTIRSADSLRIVGWFYPAQDTAGMANDLVGRVFPVPDSLRREPARTYSPEGRSRGPTIIICDGDAGNMADLIFYAYQFFTRGFNVFTFDWRGFGASGDWPMDTDLLCCTEFLQDYAAAIDYVKSRPDVDPNRIALMGFSTGAYLSFAMLATRGDLAAFAGRALITNFEDLLAVLHRVDPKRAFHAPDDFPADCLPIRAAGSVRVPALLVVGENDNRTPPWMSKKVIEQLQGPKELWIVSGAGHGSPASPEMTDYPAFFDRVAAFFRDHLSVP